MRYFAKLLDNLYLNRKVVVSVIFVVAFLIVHVLKIFLYHNFLGLVDVSFKTFVKYFTLVLGVEIILLFLFYRYKWLFVIWYFLGTIWILGNMSYYLYFGQYLYVSNIIASFFEGAKALNTLEVILNKYLLVAFVDLPFFVGLIFKGVYSQVYNLLYSRLIRIKVVVIVLVLVVYEGIALLEGRSLLNFLFSKEMRVYSNNKDSIFIRYGTVVGSFSSLVFFLNEKEFFEKNNLYEKNRFVFEGKSKRYNFVIIQVESLDATVVNTKYKGLYVMPFLSKLSKEGIYFEKVVSYHFGGATSDAEFSVITSRYPLENYPAIKIYYPDINSFVRVFVSNGYTTKVFHNNSGNYFGRDKFFKVVGFGEFFDLHRMGLKEYVWGAKDEDVFNFVKSMITNEKTNFLYYVITMSSHGPFHIIPTYYTNKHFDSIKNEMLRNYFISMNYVDRVIEDFVLFCKKYLKDTVILIFGDHSSSRWVI
ncbi:MAG: sulfatase-like hydrolase/transferase [Candidatus Omnitrophica bacterium]|nr:sulfatase-like hydrolase/transferase [Candidatus Omnitrophota bacterium]